MMQAQGEPHNNYYPCSSYRLQEADVWGARFSQGTQVSPSCTSFQSAESRDWEEDPAYCCCYPWWSLALHINATHILQLEQSMSGCPQLSKSQLRIMAVVVDRSPPIPPWTCSLSVSLVSPSGPEAPAMPHLHPPRGLRGSIYFTHLLVNPGSTHGVAPVYASAEFDLLSLR